MRYRSQAEWSSAEFNSLHHFVQDLPFDPKRAAFRLCLPTIIQSRVILNKQWTEPVCCHVSISLQEDPWGEVSEKPLMEPSLQIICEVTLCLMVYPRFLSQFRFIMSLRSETIRRLFFFNLCLKWSCYVNLTRSVLCKEKYLKPVLVPLRELNEINVIAV